MYLYLLTLKLIVIKPTNLFAKKINKKKKHRKIYIVLKIFLDENANISSLKYIYIFCFFKWMQDYLFLFDFQNK